MACGARAKVHPAWAPRWLLTRPAFDKRPRMRRMTTGLVLTLAAMRSDVTGSGLFLATRDIHAKMCIAIVSRLLELMKRPAGCFVVTILVTSRLGQALACEGRARLARRGALAEARRKWYGG